MKSSIPLRRYLLMQMGLVAILPMVIVVALMGMYLMPQMQTDIGIHHQALARTVAGQISAHLMGGERQLKALADYIQDSGSQSAEQWDALLDALCGDGDFFESVYIVDNENARIRSVGLPASRRNLRDDLLGIDISGRKLIRVAPDLNRTFWSETFLSTVSSRMAVAVAIPMKDQAVIGEITVDQLSEFISRLPVQSALITIVLDRQGRVISSSQREFSGRHFDLENFPPSEETKLGKLVSHQFELDGQPLFGTHVTIDHLGWRVLVTQPLSDIYQPIRSTLGMILFGLVIALALALVIGWLQANGIAKTSRLYAARARSIAQGHYDLQWPPSKVEEFAHLAENLKQMAKMIGQRERALVESEANLSITLDSIGDAVIVTDAQGKITRMNPMAEQLTGWFSHDAVGQPLPDVFRIVNAFTRESIANPVEKVMAEGQIVGLANHTVLIAKDGREYQIADSGAPINDSGKSIVGVVLVFRDVTEAYAREQEIRESAARLKNITANVPGVVFQFHATPDHVYSVGFVNSKAVDMLGLDVPQERFMKAFVSGIPEEDRDRYLASIRSAVDEVKTWQYEGRFIKPTGEHLWFSGSAIPQSREDGILFNGVLVDITDRRKMEEALWLTQSCLDKASIGIFRIGSEAQILAVNDQACTSLGYTQEELCRLTVFDIDPGFNPETWPGHMQRLREAGTRKIETQHQHKNGHTFPVEILINIMEFGGEEFHIAFVLDISDRKLAEHEAQKLETALQHAQKMEAIGTLAGGIAHDFNNILSAVIGYSELALSSTDLDPWMNSTMEKILAAGKRARDLVRQILTFSRRGESELKPLLVEPLVKEALKLLRSSLPTTIEISQQFSPQTRTIMADPAQIHQIVMNLCTNAAHAMEESGGRLTIQLSQLNLTDQDLRLHPELNPGNFLKLSVQDTGMGIPSDTLGKIFEPYFTTKEKGKGTGLGLSVVHGIVNSYGGAIYAYSEPECGSTFNVYIPTTGAALHAEDRKITELPGGSEHILLVDDEPVLLDIGQQMLERLGYQVSIYKNSCEALAVFRQFPDVFDLVLTDMTMPVMTGDKLAAEIMRIRPEIPIIICTGYSSLISSESALEMGIKAFLYKPIVQTDLANMVRQVLDDR
jgi:PAS domain S-box-containing protein